MGEVIPFPKKKSSAPSESGPSEPTFRDFGLAIAVGKTDFAGKVLEGLFQINEKSAQQSARFFYNKFKTNPKIMSRAMSIRISLENNDESQALAAIIECFGLVGDDAFKALERSKFMLS